MGRVAVQDDFAVRSGLEAVSERNELLPELTKVIDLPVAHEPQRAVVVRKGLVSSRKIYDREAAHADRARAIGMMPLVVRSPVHDHAAHRGHQSRVSGRAIQLENAVDPAHGQTPAAGAVLTRPARILPNSSIWPCVVAPQPNPSAYRRVAARSGGRSNSCFTACASACGVRSAINTPASGAATTSGVPHTRVATTGVPHAMDSRSTFAQPSRLEASTSASAAP